jgi:hypothetical protein
MFYIQHVTLPSFLAQKDFIGFEVTITNDDGGYLRAGIYDFSARIYQNGISQALELSWPKKNFWDNTTESLLFQVMLEKTQQEGSVVIAIFANPRPASAGFDDPTPTLSMSTRFDDLNTTILLPRSWQHDAGLFGSRIIPLYTELVDGESRDVSIRRLQFPIFQSREKGVAFERPLLEIIELPRRSYHSKLETGLVLASWLAMLAYEDGLLRTQGVANVSDIGYTLREVFTVRLKTSPQIIEIGSGEGTLGIAIATVICRMQIDRPNRSTWSPTVLLTDNSQETEAVARANIARYNRNKTVLLSDRGFGPVANIEFEHLNWEQGENVDTTGEVFASRKPWNYILVNACGRCDQYEKLIGALTKLYTTTSQVGSYKSSKVVLVVMDRSLLKHKALVTMGWKVGLIRKIPMPSSLEPTAREMCWVSLSKFPNARSARGKMNAVKHADGYVEENVGGDDGGDDENDKNEGDSSRPSSGKRDADNSEEHAPKRLCRANTV